MLDVRRTIVSEYANSPALTALIDLYNQAVDPRPDLDGFYDYVWNVLTATGFGLDVWGRIVGVGRGVYVPPGAPWFGFRDGSDDYGPFNVSPFYLRGEDLDRGGVVTLGDTAYRTLVLVKALANISDCSAPSVNRLLTALFAGRGRCYSQDTGGMHAVYKFEFSLAPYEVAILEGSPALLRPSGVRVTIDAPP